MLIIKHRVNSIQDLKNTPSHFGVEVDLRAFNEKVILSHDPFISGVEFHEWLRFYHHQLLILNVKEDGLENEILRLLKKNKIDNFFFLDQPFPTIIKTVREGCNKIALRYSEYENFLFLKQMSKTCEWVWVDSFNPYSHDRNVLQAIKELGYKICMVSSELQGRNSESERKKISHSSLNIADAICTKLTDDFL
tara:strand:- start:20347 stop:20925 length:579 start_codon:yes stop_codon:yes gene_type:complete